MSWLTNPSSAVSNALSNPGSLITAGAAPIAGIPGEGAAGNNGIFGQGSLLNNSGGGFNSPAMNPASAAEVAQNENSLLKSPQQQAAGLLAGTGAASSIANQSNNQANEQSELGGGGMPGMNQAISNKAAKNFATSQGRLQQNANFAGQQMANQNMNVAAANAIAMQNAQNGVDSSINNLNLQANASRYATISSLMSGAGALGGKYLNYQNNQYPGLSSALGGMESQFTNPGISAGTTPGSAGPGYLGSTDLGYGAGNSGELVMPSLGGS